jgi:N-acetylmuramic acid 6-phosphate etherase
LLFRTGSEVITGSTRLKAGTATKLVLNMLTTISMIRLGKVVSNLMVDVKPTNAKLRARACRIVATLGRCDDEEARKRLVRCGWNVKKALR